jgi:hypothetical protein
MPRGFPAILAVLLATIPADLAAQNATLPQRTVYVCATSISIPGDVAGSLSLEKVFLEDGSVPRQSVTLSDGGSFIRTFPAAQQVSVTLTWPGDHRTRSRPEPLGWSDGSIRIYLFSPSIYRTERGEFWQETIVDRDNSAMVYERNGTRMLFLNLSDMQLTSGLASHGGAGILNASIDNLLAWGTGVERLTVYHVLVQRRRYRRHSYPNDPAGRRRIVGQFEIDTASFARRAAQAREAAIAWEAGIGDFRTCLRQTEYVGQEVVITSGP